MVLGMFAWCSPGYRSWGGMVIALLVLFTLWLVAGTLAGERSVPGHPVYFALLGPAAVLAWHLAGTHLGTPAAAGQAGTPLGTSLAGGQAGAGQAGMYGAINVSMLFQAALLALGVMLTQGLLPRGGQGLLPRGGRGQAALIGVCGAAMAGGAIVAVAPEGGSAGALRNALALMGFSGVGVWLSALGLCQPSTDDSGATPKGCPSGTP